jgi:hypothetical protein
VQAEDNPLTAISLQGIDGFVWRGDAAAVSPYGVISPESPLFPASFWAHDRGALWHVHQGWYEEAEEHKRTLNRFHADAVERDSEFRIIFDHMMRTEWREGLPATVLSENAGAFQDERFNHFHAKNKEAICAVLTPEMADRISLNVG